MQPQSARDFLKAALQRWTAAKEIFERLGLTVEAQYIGGYTVECALKALILHRTTVANRPEAVSKLTRGAAAHRKEVLLQFLRDLGVTLTPELARRMRRFEWTTQLRYETGRLDSGETRALLKTARQIYDWVERRMP